MQPPKYLTTAINRFIYAIIMEIALTDIAYLFAACPVAQLHNPFVH